MGTYNEGETGNMLALWEDFELRRFLPLLPAQLILDFSKKISAGCDGGKEKRARVQRILAARRVLLDIVKIDQEGVYFDQKSKKFLIGVEPQLSEDFMCTSLTDMTEYYCTRQEDQVEKIVKQANGQAYSEGEDDDEVIVIKPAIVEKPVDAVSPKLISNQEARHSYCCTVRLPLASNEEPESRVVESPRACAKKFPKLVSQGLLFVWPDENGWDKASASKPAMLQGGGNAWWQAHKTFRGSLVKGSCSQAHWFPGVPPFQLFNCLLLHPAEEYTGLAWEELKHIRQAIGFLNFARFSAYNSYTELVQCSGMTNIAPTVSHRMLFEV
ncbi:hypothetical protein MKW98_018723 [Papaver atlanticum]|uniref:Uncharacterized protein n=1 Tax=Papaver atlanticum TaxID=357466 RepID=A0AAD4T2L9_9MAGN|nr:hypothetical protein MKW98_018723 [Papaver atlanticum]